MPGKSCIILLWWNLCVYQFPHTVCVQVAAARFCPLTQCCVSMREEQRTPACFGSQWCALAKCGMLKSWASKTALNLKAISYVLPFNRRFILVSCGVSVSLHKSRSTIDIIEVEKLPGSQTRVSHTPRYKVCVLHWRLDIIHQRLAFLGAQRICSRATADSSPSETCW